MVDFGGVLDDAEIRKQFKQAHDERILSLFNLLDRHKLGRLSWKEMWPFAQACGFDGSETEWADEYQKTCQRYDWNAKIGPDHCDFKRLLDDERGVGHCTDDELKAVLSTLRRKLDPEGETETDARKPKAAEACKQKQLNTGKVKGMMRAMNIIKGTKLVSTAPAETE
mmetsp:Transcript_4486/g.12630  ORF Transcript_4486/g.12630 Transcript_4486/m.12630 type:complete len:168 (+) Transcript_4486:64-567(+)|eukprot:CAMPEP_0179320556 /NCGR_PEP_ID=MMETSP0797-20121207/58114_1 /TAXON_ID=47934 /ORGANISM="Dinophysis acuminata, Strain DAEP01" /LENGTH=167 /DNA_ID=CAMNT_0021032067 /DNA_START=49 /DNA_END=552 /DNA_ORIENTATION=+